MTNRVNKTFDYAFESSRVKKIWYIPDLMFEPSC